MARKSVPKMDTRGEVVHIKIRGTRVASPTVTFVRTALPFFFQSEPFERTGKVRRMVLASSYVAKILAYSNQEKCSEEQPLLGISSINPTIGSICAVVHVSAHPPASTSITSREKLPYRRAC